MRGFRGSAVRFGFAAEVWVASALLAAHSETVAAGAKMPVRQQRQVSTMAVTGAGYDSSTPRATTAASTLP